MKVDVVIPIFNYFSREKMNENGLEKNGNYNSGGCVFCK